MTTIPQLQRFIYFPIRDLKATRNLVSHLVTSPNDSIILPYIDHPGPLSSEILSRDFRSLTVCETNRDTRNKFQAFIAAEHQNKNIHVHADDLFDLSHRTHSDLAQKRCADLVRFGRDVKDPSIASGIFDRNVRLLVPLLKSRNESGFLRNLYYQVSLKLGLCSNSFVNYYFLMSDRQLAYMTAKTGGSMKLYRSASVLYNTLFCIKTLESYDLEKCFHINVRRIQNTVAANNASYSKVHLVLIRPNLDIIDSLSPRSLIEFRFLVTQMMQKRRGLVFEFLDRFFSNYKSDLTCISIDSTTKCGDLTKEQYYELFLYLIKRPDYRGSTFLQAVATGEENILSL